jgi:hypothetical protein
LEDAMSNVWIVRETKHDLNGLERFGEVCEVFNKTITPLDVEQQGQIIQDEVFRAASSEDYILTAGPTIMVVNFLTLWIQRFGKARVIIFDSRRRKYRVKDIPPGTI